MKFLNSLLLSAVCSLWLSAPARAHTHFTPPLQPELVASERSSYLIAKTWFLPDYQGDTSSRSETNNNPGGEDLKGECGTYGLIAACASPKEPYGKKHPRQDLTCYTGCKCSEVTYPFNSSNCNLSRYTLKGDNCDGLYKTCAPKSCPQGSQISCASNQVRTPNGSYSGNSPCYTCRDKTCAEGGASCAAGTKCVGFGASALCRNNTCPDTYGLSPCNANQVELPPRTNTAAGSTCYKCRAATCADRGLLADTPPGKVCETVSFAGNICHSNCWNACVGSSSCSGQLQQCAANQNEVASCVDCSGNTRYTCAAKDDTCPDGYSKTACNSNQNEIDKKYTEAGSTCYSCKDKTCADGGYLTFAPADQVCRTIRYGMFLCQTDCRDKTCADGGYESSEPSGQACDTVSYAGLTCYDSCSARKKCIEMGYTKTKCPANEKVIKCLYDNSLVRCMRMTLDYLVIICNNKEYRCPKDYATCAHATSGKAPNCMTGNDYGPAILPE